MRNRFFSIYRLWLAGCLALLPASQAQAQRVGIAIDGNLTAGAEYVAGQADKPAVLILHGFLQTAEFPIIRQLTQHLAGEGYTVLAPTLTLGITGRRQSLPCEAINAHTMQGTAKEIAVWMRWLQKRRPKVILVGHSFGTVYLLNYLEESHDPAVTKLVGISTVEGGLSMVDSPRRQALLEKLRRQAANPKPTLVRQAFAFCRQYQSTPQGLLSYLEWSPERIIASIERQPTRLAFIMGSADDRLGPDWIGRLQATPARVHVIKGANHFMDGQYEFDMLERLLDELKN